MADPKEIFGKRIREARKLRDMSQLQLGSALGLDTRGAVQTIHRYERQLRFPRDLTVITRIAEVLKISPSYFFTNDDDLASVILLWGELSQKQKGKVLEQCDFFADLMSS